MLIRSLLNLKPRMQITIILPLNQLCDQIIVLEADALDVQNRFLLGSQVPEVSKQRLLLK